MGNHHNSVGWAVIGTPGGIQSKNFGCIADFDLTALVDINSLIIRVTPHSELFCHFREVRNGALINYFILYHYAKEIRTDRTGTFCGSVLVLVNQIAEGKAIVQTLRELLGSLGTYLGPDGRFKTSMGQVDIPEPSAIQRVIDSLKPAVRENTDGRSTGIIRLPEAYDEAAVTFFDFITGVQLGRTFNRVFGTNNTEILNYVKERGQIRFIDPTRIELELELTRVREDLEQISQAHKALLQEKENLERQTAIEIDDLREKLAVFETDNEQLREKTQGLEKMRTLNDNLLLKEQEITGLKLENEEFKVSNKQLKREREELLKLLSRDTQKAGLKRDHPAAYQNSHRNQVQDEESRKKRNFNQIAHELMTSRKSPVFWIICFVIILFLFILIRFLSGGPSVDTDNRDSASFPVRTTVPVSVPKPDDNEILSKTDQFIDAANSSGNVYDNVKLNNLIDSLAAAGLDSMQQYKELMRLKQDFALLKAEWSQVKERNYSVNKDGESLSAVEKEIYQIDPRAYDIKDFKAKLKIYNHSLSDGPLKKGTNITYYVLQ